MTPSATHHPETDDPPRPKATLFCPTCDHESPPDGDWRRLRRRDRVEYVCPVCATTITRRPRDHERDRASDGDDERPGDAGRDRHPVTRIVGAWARAAIVASRAWGRLGRRAFAH